MISCEWLFNFSLYSYCYVWIWNVHYRIMCWTPGPQFVPCCEHCPAFGRGLAGEKQTTTDRSTLLSLLPVLWTAALPQAPISVRAVSPFPAIGDRNCSDTVSQIKQYNHSSGLQGYSNTSIWGRVCLIICCCSKCQMLLTFRRYWCLNL